MYETGHPGRAQRHPRLQRLRRPRRPHRIPGSDPRHGRSGRRPGARPARPGRRHGRRGCARRRTGSKPPATRSPPKSRRWPAPARAVQERQPKLVAARGRARCGAGEDQRPPRKTSTATSPRSRARSPPSSPATGSAPLPAGPIQPAQRQRPDLAGRRAGRLRLRPAHDRGRYECHPGIDIAVPAGTPIRAAASGTVIFTQPEASSGGYGNYTCIDHGGGLPTCYAHQSAFAVTPGQRSPRATSSATSAAPATASALTSTSRSGSTASPIRWLP